MNAAEIKKMYPVREIFRQYGIAVNRAGFAHCPFHKGDRTPSLKVYSDSWHCYGCHANGDIFTFVQLMDHCDFKTAFHKLGGTYNYISRAERAKINSANEARQRKKWVAERKAVEARRQAERIDSLRKRIDELQPLSDEWCDAMTELQAAQEQAGYFEEV